MLYRQSCSRKQIIYKMFNMYNTADIIVVCVIFCLVSVQPVYLSLQSHLAMSAINSTISTGHCVSFGCMICEFAHFWLIKMEKNKPEPLDLLHARSPPVVLIFLKKPCKWASQCWSAIYLVLTKYLVNNLFFRRVLSEMSSYIKFLMTFGSRLYYSDNIC